jgi:hypothetical protein
MPRNLGLVWQKPTPSQIQLALPSAVVDALVVGGYVENTELAITASLTASGC